MAPTRKTSSSLNTTKVIMAPTRKTTSSSNTTKVNLMKALKRNHSAGETSGTSKKLKASTKNHAAGETSGLAKKALKGSTVQPPSQSSSPKSEKKKAISTNLQQQLSKKRKQREEGPIDNEQGVKHLKRGPVTMVRILRRKMLGVKLAVSFNAKGEPYGKVATEMQSYIGVLSRTKAPIWYETWKRVPKEKKNKIWDCVQMAFDIPLTARRIVLKSACQKWREFKSRLTTTYILPYRDQPELLESPPADYNFIEKAHWDIFVADRLSPDFLELHNKHKNIRSMNKYGHYMSRKGYANLEQEMSGGDPEIEIDRASTWLRARCDKDGKYKTEKLVTIAEEIEKMKKKVEEGEVTEEGTNDVLTKVLGNSEHRGRVRGQGSYVKQSNYFNLPRQKRKNRSIEEKIQEGIQKFMADETNRIIKERDEFWAAEMAKLKEALSIKIDGSPNIGSQQGSCSKGGLENVLELTAVKKKLDLNESPRGEDAENNFQEVDDEEKNKDKEKDVAELKSSGEEKGVEYLVVEDTDVEVAEENEGILWELAIGTPTNIVAHATVDFVTAVLHGKPLGGDNVRVSITRVIQGAAEIPFPIDDEIITVDQAVGTFIAWPRNMLREVKANSDRVKSRAVKGGKKNGPRKMKKVNDLVSEPEPVVNMGPDFPPTLKKLWLWASDALKDGRSQAFKLSEEAFGSSDKKCLFKSDISAVCFGGEISGTVICMFINILQENLRKHKMTDMISFVDPAKIGALGCGTPAARSRALALRFKSAKPSQVFLLPYHHTNHWALTVVNPDAQMVYHLDPLKRRIANEEWIEVVNNGIKIYKEDVKRFLKKKINWENLAGVPAQTGTTDCGLFVMLYMREICIDKELKFASKWARRSNLVFDSDDLNEIRSAWAKYFMRQHAS